MSSSEAEEATPRGGEGGALKRRGTPGDATRAGELDLHALVNAHFVSIVRGYEELYMCDHPLYTDRQRRRDVWEEIGTIVNQPAEDCRKRWTRIRENYFRSVKRAKKDANETVFHAERPVHEKLMSFLNPSFETKKEVYDKIVTTVLNSDKETQESENNDSSDDDNSLSKEKHSTAVSDSSSSDDVQGPTTQAVEAEPAPGQQQSQLEHDDIVDFFVELGEAVKDFPEGVRIHVKREAFKIVTDAEEILYHQKIKAGLEMNMSEEHE